MNKELENVLEKIKSEEFTFRKGIRSITSNGEEVYTDLHYEEIESKF